MSSIQIAHSQTVVTWQTPSGSSINICTSCEETLTTAREWPRNGRGEQYCSVSHGAHRGTCSITDPQTGAFGRR